MRKHLRILAVSLSLGAVLLSAGEGFPDDTSPAKLEEPAAPKEEVAAAEPQRKPADVWQEIDEAMRLIGQAVEKNNFEKASEPALKVADGMRWLVDHPPSSDAGHVNSLQVTVEHALYFLQTLREEAVKKNSMTVTYSHRKLTQNLESLRNLYNNPPAAKPSPKPAAPASTAKETAPAKPDKSPDTAAKPPVKDTKPKSVSEQDTKQTSKSKPASPAAPAKKK